MELRGLLEFTVGRVEKDELDKQLSGRAPGFSLQHQGKQNRRQKVEWQLPFRVIASTDLI